MKNIIRIILPAAALVLSATVAAAQNSEQRLTPEVMARLFPRAVVSPDYGKDGEVTFRFKAPEAEKVELNCQAFEGNKPMTKDEEGVWSVTVRIEVPDVYPYCFIVNGMQVADPANMYIFPNEGFKNSLADVRAEAPTMQDMQNVPHGKVSYRYYNSKRLGFDRPLCVYTPADYDPAGKEKLPVFYLIHGMTDTYETWFKVGRVNVIMDNLIAQGLAKRMIIVMPYANPYPEMITRGLAQAYDAMGTDIVVREIIDEVMPYIKENYNILTGPDNTAVAGFSLGGRQALATGFGNPDIFHWVAAYAPAIFGNEYETNFSNGVYAKPAELQSKLKLVWLGTGTSDFLVQASRGLDAYMTAQGLDHKTYWPAGGHTWMNCRDYLELTAKQLFK